MENLASQSNGKGAKGTSYEVPARCDYGVCMDVLCVPQCQGPSPVKLIDVLHAVHHYMEAGRHIRTQFPLIYNCSLSIGTDPTGDWNASQKLVR